MSCCSDGFRGLAARTLCPLLDAQHAFAHHDDVREFHKQVEEDRDPLRAPSDRLRLELAGDRPEVKLSKPERELVAFLELHPGTHNLKDLEPCIAEWSDAPVATSRAQD